MHHLHRHSTLWLEESSIFLPFLFCFSLYLSLSCLALSRFSFSSTLVYSGAVLMDSLIFAPNALCLQLIDYLVKENYKTLAVVPSRGTSTDFLSRCLCFLLGFISLLFNEFISGFVNFNLGLNACLTLL